MTNEEAIELLKNGTMFMPTLQNSEYPEAFDLAIKALQKEELQSDLISREALKEKVQEIVETEMPIDEKWAIGLRHSLKLIDNAPTVPLPDFKEGYKQAIIDGKTNFSRPQGEWINHRNDYGHNIADCSECGKTMQWHDEDEDGIPRYCWYCGAYMQKGGAE